MVIIMIILMITIIPMNTIMVIFRCILALNSSHY